jgi:uncharacterized delta-60 repeat protein
VSAASTRSASPSHPTTGSSGAVTGPNIAAEAVALQADGKIVVGGTTPNPIFGGTSPDFALARLDAVGALDPSFGTGGTVRTDFDTGRDILESLLVQPDGKIVAAGHAAVGFSGADFALARSTPTAAWIRHSARTTAPPWPAR